jgi:hypothetical protein
MNRIGVSNGQALLSEQDHRMGRSYQVWISCPFILAGIYISAGASPVTPHKLASTGRYKWPAYSWVGKHQLVVWDTAAGGPFVIVDTLDHKRKQVTSWTNSHARRPGYLHFFGTTGYWIALSNGSPSTEFFSMKLGENGAKRYDLPDFPSTDFAIVRDDAGVGLWLFSSRYGKDTANRYELEKPGFQHTEVPAAWPNGDKERCELSVIGGVTHGTIIGFKRSERNDRDIQICEIKPSARMVSCVLHPLVLPPSRKLVSAIVCGDYVVLTLVNRSKGALNSPESVELWRCLKSGEHVNRIFSFPWHSQRGLFRYDDNEPNYIAASPDGKHITYILKNQIWSLPIAQ